MAESAHKEIERGEDYTATDGQVVRLGYSLLQAGHLAGERQCPHASLLRSQTPSRSPLPPEAVR
jgi:hypothetical protein